MPRTSHVATRPKKHVSDASVPRCHGLLQQAPPRVCSWLVVKGVLQVIRTIISSKEAGQPTIYVHEIRVMVVLLIMYSYIVLKQGGDDSTLSSLRT